MDLLDLLKLHEGFRATPYRCTAGKITIGYGRNLEDCPLDEEEAVFLLLRPVREAAEDIQTFNFGRYLNEARAAAVIDMRYNLGPTRFRGFKRFIAAMDRKDYDTAAAEMLDSRWATQVGDRAIRLSEIIRTGEFQNAIRH